MSVLAARQWAEGQPECSWSGHVDSVAETSGAITCPKCARFMSKFRIGAGVGNRLDLCSHCGEFWLDAGEWALLGALELRGRLPAIFSQPWQLGLREREAAEARQQRLLDTLGAEDLARVQDFARWLKSHPQRALIRRQLDQG